MLTLHKKIKKHSALIIFSSLLLTFSTSWAESDVQLMEKSLKTSEDQKNKPKDHSSHKKTVDSSGVFRGVFYGYPPCKKKGCDGSVKTTLSLKNKNNYLLVTQNAKTSSREYFEKGKYVWDEQSLLLTLTPKKKTAEKQQFSIQNDATLIQLNNDGTLPINLKKYTLQKRDSIETRQVHLH